MICQELRCIALSSDLGISLTLRLLTKMFDASRYPDWRVCSANSSYTRTVFRADAGVACQIVRSRCNFYSRRELSTDLSCRFVGYASISRIPGSSGADIVVVPAIIPRIQTSRSGYHCSIMTLNSCRGACCDYSRRTAVAVN